MQPSIVEVEQQAQAQQRREKLKSQMYGHPAARNDLLKQWNSLHDPSAGVGERIPQDVGRRAEHDAANCQTRFADGEGGGFAGGRGGSGGGAGKKKNVSGGEPIENQQKNNSERKR